MRYYLGVDWADQTHAVWVVDEQGAKVASRAVPHTAAGLSEWGRELDEWRAQGFELWAAIERPEGRVVDFLLDHGVVVYPVNPKALDRARDRFRPSAAKSDAFRARVLAEFPPHGSRAPAGLAAEFGGGPGAQVPHGGLPTACSAADPPGQPADGHAKGLLSAGARGERVDDGAGATVSAGLSDARSGGGPHEKAVAAVGARPPAERRPGSSALGVPPAAATAGAGPRGPGQGPADADPGGGTDRGRGGRWPVSGGDRRFFRRLAGGAVDPDAPDR